MSQGSGAPRFLAEQIKVSQLDVEVCGIKMLDRYGDVATLLAIKRVQLKDEATVNQLQSDLQAVR